MSAYHHKGKLVSIDGEWATYEYYPDYLSYESAVGLFKVKPSSLVGEQEREYEILAKAGDVKLFSNRPEEHVIFTLLSKIRKSAENGELFPEEVYHIA
ncbi:hypothetical protein [Microbulbifer sp. PAAF003]|uniref:hypothetical protein n=1 Tax=Microbulbifer sp. PAAF003 TaxID=3243375 RepID=UPI00403A30F2